jgi:hypothetical protein
LILSIAGVTGDGVVGGQDLSGFIDRSQSFDIESAVGKRIDTSDFVLMDTLPSSLSIPDKAEIIIYDVANNPFASWAAAVLALKPAAYYRLNDAGTTARDWSGNGNTGTLAGGITKGVAGGLSDGDTAMAFDGSTGMISSPTSPTWNPSGNNPFTIAALVKPNAVNATTQRLLGREPATNHGAFLFLGLDNHWRVLRGDSAAGIDQPSVATVTPQVGVYHFLVATYDGATLTIWANGIKGTPTASTRLVDVGTSAITIGKTGIGGNPGITVDEAIFLNYALTDAQVQALSALVSTSVTDPQVTDPPWAVSAYNTWRNGAGNESTSSTAANWTSRLFGGYVATPKYTSDGAQRYIGLASQDYTVRLRTTVANMAFANGISDQTIIRQIFARYRPDYDTTHVDQVLAAFPAITYPVHTLEQCLERIIKVTRGYYRADYFKQLWYGVAGQQVAPFNLSDIPDYNLPMLPSVGFETVDPNDPTMPFNWSRANTQSPSMPRLDEAAAGGDFEEATTTGVQVYWAMVAAGEWAMVTGAGDFKNGVSAVKCTRTNLGPNNWNTLKSQVYIPVVVGQSYTMSVWHKQNAGAQSGHAKINWYDVNLVFLSSSFTTSTTGLVANYTQKSVTAVAPANAAFAKIELLAGWWDGVTGTDAQVWFDDCRFAVAASIAAHAGSHGMAMDNPQSGKYAGMFSKRGFRVSPGELLNLSIWLKATTAARSFGPFRLVFGTPDGVRTFADGSAVSQPSNTTGATVVDSFFSPTASWANYTAQVTVPAGAVWCWVELYANGSSQAAWPTTFYVDDVAVTRPIPTFPTEGLNYTPDGSGLANRVWVIGSTYLSAQQVYQVPPALVNGTNYQFPLPGNPELTGMSVTVAGVNQGQIGVAPGDGDIAMPSGFKYNAIIQHNPALIAFKTPPSVGQAVAVTGQFRYPLVQVVTDSALVAAAGGIVFETVVRDKRINDLGLAKSVGQSFLKNQGSTLKGGSCEVRNRGVAGVLLQPGHMITIKNDVLFRNLLKDAAGLPTTTAVVIVTQLRTVLDDDTVQPYKVVISFADRNVSGGY